VLFFCDFRVPRARGLILTWGAAMMSYVVGARSLRFHPMNKWILAAILTAAALFMYVSIFVKVGSG